MIEEVILWKPNANALWITNSLNSWSSGLKLPETERDYTVGALYLLKLSGNQILYKNIVAALDKRHDVIEYQLQKYYNFRVQALTHVQVEEMSAQVEDIVAEHIPLVQEMMLAQVGSPLAIENAHRNLLDKEDDE